MYIYVYINTYTDTYILIPILQETLVIDFPGFF